MIDPITALAAVSSAVNMIKKAAATVDDVASLGPLLGKYFDAKHEATKAVREAKKEGGSNLGKAVELELALKAQRDFEEQIKGLFFSSNNMDIWNNIMQRVAEMNAEDRAEAERERVRERNRKRRQKELEDMAVGLFLAGVILAAFGYGLYEFVEYCRASRCSA